MAHVEIRQPDGLAALVSAQGTSLVAPSDILADLDTQLMLQVRDGNREAANTLIRRNFERVARYVARLVRDSRPAEDLAQDVFVQILSHASAYQPTARFSTWLYRIATNTSLKYLDQAHVRRRADRLPDDGGPLPDRAVASPGRQLDVAELRGRVSDAIGALPGQQRVALTLFEYENFSYEQIAAVLNVTVEAVRCLLTRARATLRTRLTGLL